MRNKSLIVLACIAILVSVAVGFTWHINNIMYNNSMHLTPGNASSTTAVGTIKNTHEYSKNLIKPKEGQPIKRISLVAKESSLLIKDGLALPVWTYNGTVPGTEIRVTQNDFLQVELKNELNDPVTIHWHGYPLPSAMDGVPGVNQDSVKPGETFIYEFSADVAGTYWYHSHQEGARQVDMGLYGAFIVEPLEKLKVNKDFTLILDEWMEKPTEGMSSMGGSTDPVMAEAEMMASSYNIYTVNGKSGSLIFPLEVKKGDTVRLRFINAGYRSHGVHIPGQEFRVVSTDGQHIIGASIVRDQVLLIAPGERYDVEFAISSDEDFYIDAHDENKYSNQIKIPVRVLDGNGILRMDTVGDSFPLFDLSSYGIPSSGKFSLDQKYDIDYKVELGTNMENNILKYTINGQVFGKLPSLKMKTGDVVKLTFENKSKVDHPMHLHGHFFEVLSKDDIPVKGAFITKDTLLVRPGEKYVVAFQADNTGKWVQHCHELHHAAAGMVQEIEYTDFKPNYNPDPNNRDNKPE